MLVEKHSRRQEMHEDLLVSLSTKEMGVGDDVALGLLFQAMIGSSQIAKYVLGNFPLHISNFILLLLN